jgi:hypothetical protein
VLRGIGNLSIIIKNSYTHRIYFYEFVFKINKSRYKLQKGNMMAKIIYTLKEHPRTGEYHLFEAKPTSSTQCMPEKKSMCTQMDNIKGFIFACASEEEAFDKCAKLGRKVCGNCMKELYGTYD